MCTVNYVSTVNFCTVCSFYDLGNPDGVSDGAMDGKAAKDEAVVYQEGKMLVQGNARIGVQGSTSGAGSSQPCNKQG